MRVLALDYGSARCGCALSDPTGTIVTPIEPIERPATKRGLGRLRALITGRDVELAVAAAGKAFSDRWRHAAVKERADLCDAVAEMRLQ